MLSLFLSYMHTHMHAHTHTHTHTHIHTHTHTYTHTHTHTHTYTHTLFSYLIIKIIQLYKNESKESLCRMKNKQDACTHMYTHTPTHPHTHIHSHTRIPSNLQDKHILCTVECTTVTSTCGMKRNFELSVFELV